MRKAILAGALVLAFAGCWLGWRAFFAGYRAPRTSFGDPDLQGLWTNVSRTWLERKSGMPLVLNPDRARRMEEKFREKIEQIDFFDPGAPPEIMPDQGKGIPRKRAMLGYNTFWVDIGAEYAAVNGEIRSSWIVDPPDGRVPYTQYSLDEMKKGFALHMRNDGPEFRRIGERCLLGFGSSGGPPMLNVEYNNHYRIVQAPGYVAILVEMVHDVRVIPIGGPGLPEGMRAWMGDSVGRWEGDSLVVETRNLHPTQLYVFENGHLLYISKDAKITERFTRVAEGEIFYEFRVEDPLAYRQPWRAEMAFRASDGPMYEFACHEGNRSMENMLSGARYEEKKKMRKEEK